MFIQSNVLIVALFIIDRLIRKRVRATFRYWIWMLIFIKLVLPPTLSLPTGIGNWFGDYFSADSIVTNQQAYFIPSESPDITTSVKVGDYAVIPKIPSSAIETFRESTEPVLSAVPAVSETPMTIASPDVPVAPALNALTWQGVIFLLWLVGVLVISVLLVQRIFFVRGLVAQSDPAKNQLVDILEKCREQVGVRRNIRLRLSPNVTSPAVCWLFGPVILIPKILLEQLSQDKLRAVLIHELAHIKRGDLWINCVQTFLQIAYFYNPFVWLANTVVRRIREQAVDEMVLVALGEAAQSYSNTLIDIAEMAFSRPALSLRLVGVVESKKALTGRIKHILHRPFPKSAKLGFIGLLTIIIFAAILLPMAKAYRVTKLGGLYEKAKVSEDFKVKAGPTKFAANFVVRWDRDGEYIIRGPDGSKFGMQALPIPDFHTQATWMDIAQLYISPDIERYEVIELRVFDHNKRELISDEDYIGVGYNIRNSVATIYSIGQLLPEELDVWMRVIHKPSGTIVSQIPAQENAVVKLPDNMLKILEIKKGVYNYSSGPSGVNWTEHHSEHDESATSVAFQFNEKDNKKYQICAISKDSERFVPDYPHFISSVNARINVIEIGLPKEKIDHFEITPFISRDTLYFDGIKLPKVSDAFSSCPLVMFEINGSEGEFTSNILSPLELKLYAYGNKKVTGVSGSADNWRNTFKIGQAKEGTSGFALKINGMRTKNLHLAYFNQSGKRIDPDNNRNKSRASGGSTTIGADSIKVPLEQIHSVGLQISKEGIKEQQIDTKKPNQFKAALPNGVTVELLGVCEHPSEGKQWWRPDGTMIDDDFRPYRFERFRRMRLPSNQQENKIVELAVKVANSRNGNVGIICSGANTTFVNCFNNIWGGTTELGKQLEKKDIITGVATGPWESVASSAANFGFRRRSTPGIIFTEAYSTQQGYAIVTVTHKTDIQKENWRIVAIDEEGKLHNADSYQEQEIDELKQNMVHFRKLKSKQIRRFEFQTRPYEWVTFKNVSLQPGMKTDVRVETADYTENPLFQTDQNEKIIGIIKDVNGNIGEITSEYGDAIYGNNIRYTPSLYLGRVRKGVKVQLMYPNVIESRHRIPIIKIKTISECPGLHTGTIGWIQLKNTSFKDQFIAYENIPLEPNHKTEVQVEAGLLSEKENVQPVRRSVAAGTGEQGNDKIILQANVFSVNAPLSLITNHLRDELGVNNTTTDLDETQAAQFKKWIAALPDTTMISSPTALVFDGQKADLNVTSQNEFIVDYEKTSDSPPQYKPKRQKFTTGVELFFIPELKHDDNLIILTLDLKQRDVVKIESKPHESGNQIELPVIDTTEIHTQVAVPLGKYFLVSAAGMYSAENGSQPDQPVKQTILLVKADVQAEVKGEPSDSRIPEEIVGTWFFDNPMGDEEQMAIFKDGRAVVLYSNGHKDQTRYENGFIELAEYGNARFKMAILENGTIVQYLDTETGGLAKRWVRIDSQPHIELLRPLTGQDNSQTDVLDEVDSQTQAEVLKQLKDITQVMIQAFNAGDIDTILFYFTDDVISLPDQHEVAIGKDALRNLYLKNKKENTKIHSINNLEQKLWICGDFVFETGKVVMSFTTPTTRFQLSDWRNYVTLWTRQPDGSIKTMLESSNPALIPEDGNIPELATPIVIDVASGTEPSDDNMEAVYGQIRQYESTFHKAFIERNIEVAAGFYADDAILMPWRQNALKGKKEITEHINEDMAKSLLVNMTQNVLHIEGNSRMLYAVNLFTWTFKDASSGQDVTMPGKGVHVWARQQDGSWKILLDLHNVNVPMSGD